MLAKKKSRNTCSQIKAVLFDFDGTLTQPGAIDFIGIKKAINCPPDRPILEYIETLSNQVEREQALSIINKREMESAEKSFPIDNAEDIVLFLKSKGIKVGVISRNGDDQLKRALENFAKLEWSDFDIVISRDTPVRYKPSSEGIELAMSKMDVDRQEIILVGDFLFDIQAGNAAGVITVLLHHGDEGTQPQGWENDYTIYRLSQLKPLLEPVIPISGGKLPNRFLDGFLTELDLNDPSLIIKPGVGEDTAAIDIKNEEVIILKSDPITFVTDSLWYYSLIINSNDIATSGAIPRWFLTTLLFPSGSTPAFILRTMAELKNTCKQMDITLCGGHTEITNAVNRPVVCGTLIGTVSRSRLVDKAKMETGDRILLTKRVSVEGTAIIASEFGERLIQSGMCEAEIERCIQFKNHISILPEAKVAMQFEKGIHAMHDVTEGGLAIALEEVSRAGQHRIKIDLEKIPIYEQTRKVCRLLNLNSLGLIGSGSLIICCEEGIHQQVTEALIKEKIEVSCIGKVLEAGTGIEANKNGQSEEWPSFETDEITRLF